MADEIIEEVTPDAYEADAVKYGWKPAEDFQGDSDSHMSAEAFMTRGPGTSRKALASNEVLTKQLEASQAGMDARFERMERANKAREDARVNAEVERLTARKREAAESGDMDLYDELDKAPEVEVAKAPVEDIPNDVRVAMDAWLPANPWFKQDALANSDAIAWFSSLQAQGKSPEEALTEISSRAKQKHPWLFPEPEKQRTMSSVDGGGLPVRRSGKKGWNDIPDDDRRLVKGQIDRGEWNDLAKTMKTSAQEAYASEYWGPES